MFKIAVLIAATATFAVTVIAAELPAGHAQDKATPPQNLAVPPGTLPREASQPALPQGRENSEAMSRRSRQNQTTDTEIHAPRPGLGTELSVEPPSQPAPGISPPARPQ